MPAMHTAEERQLMRSEYLRAQRADLAARLADDGASVSMTFKLVASSDHMTRDRAQAGFARCFAVLGPQGTSELLRLTIDNVFDEVYECLREAA